MHKLITIAIALHFAFVITNAQDNQGIFYFSGEIGVGNYQEIDLNLNYITESKYSLKFGFSTHFRQSVSQPADFNSGLAGIFTFGFAQLHFDRMDSYQLLFGRIIEIEDIGNIRYNLAGGIAYTVITEPTNWKRVSGSTLGANYTHDMEERTTFSLLINPKIEFPLSRIIGLTISPMLRLSNDRSFIGIGAGVLIGLLKHQ